MARFFAMSIVALGLAGCWWRTHAHRVHAASTPLVVATPISVPLKKIHGVAPIAPRSWPSSLAGTQAERYRALASRARRCRSAQVATRIHGTLFIGCSDGVIVTVGSHGNILASTKVPMDDMSSILSVGHGAIVVSGGDDGAFMSVALAILRAATLRPIGPKVISDSTFLGVIGDRAYFDDWCCFGRPDEYRPATIYYISLKTGSESPSVDLVPDPKAHPANAQPLGQGEHNYLIGRHLYVVVGSVTYRYDIMNLTRKPMRMHTP